VQLKFWEVFDPIKELMVHNMMMMMTTMMMMMRRRRRRRRRITIPMFLCCFDTHFDTDD